VDEAILDRHLHEASVMKPLALFQEGFAVFGVHALQ
jgi:hypothetical protein